MLLRSVLIYVLISGKVQGVFFRAFIKERADELELKGWARNTENGKVEAVFNGPEDKVQKMLDWCWQGTAGSKVTSVKSATSVKSEEKLTRFEIRY